MTKTEAIKVLEMFLHKQCDLERTKFAYDELTVWDAVKMASEALKGIEPEIIRCKYCIHYRVYDNLPYCDRAGFYGYGWKNDDYCSYAERRTNGET